MKECGRCKKLLQGHDLETPCYHCGTPKAQARIRDLIAEHQAAIVELTAWLDEPPASAQKPHTVLERLIVAIAAWRAETRKEKPE